MPPAARVGDLHSCPLSDGPKPHVGGPITTGAPTVIICGQPAARVGDMATCAGPPDSIAQGEPSVLIAGMPAARLSDMTAHGGVITSGCPTALIGVPAGGTCLANASKVGAPFVDEASMGGAPVADAAATNSAPGVGAGSANGVPVVGGGSASGVPVVGAGSTGGAPIAEGLTDTGIEDEILSAVPNAAGKMALSGKGGGFFSGVRDVIGRIWALPNTLIGLAYGGIGTLFGAPPVWNSQDGILEFKNMPEWMMPSAMSLGHVHLFGPNHYIPSVRKEELLHTRQAEILGPFYLPLHALSMGISVLTGGGTHGNNPLEKGPQRGTGPWPWS